MRVMEIAVIIFVALATLAILAMFVRSRARQGIRPFEITDEDKADFQEVRREFGIRRVLGGLLGMLGGVLVVGGFLEVCSSLFDSFAEVDWRTMVVMTALGVALVLCALPLIRQSR